VALHPNGETIAAGNTAHTVYLWPTSTVDQALALHGHTNAVRAVLFHPDGRTVISGSSDETVKLWDLHEGRCLATVRAPRPYENMCITGATGSDNGAAGGAARIGSGGVVQSTD